MSSFWYGNLDRFLGKLSGSRLDQQPLRGSVLIIVVLGLAAGASPERCVPLHEMEIRTESLIDPVIGSLCGLF